VLCVVCCALRVSGDDVSVVSCPSRAALPVLGQLPVQRGQAGAFCLPRASLHGHRHPQRAPAVRRLPAAQVPRAPHRRLASGLTRVHLLLLLGKKATWLMKHIKGTSIKFKSNQTVFNYRRTLLFISTCQNESKQHINKTKTRLTKTRLTS